VIDLPSARRLPFNETIDSEQYLYSRVRDIAWRKGIAVACAVSHVQL
jgi:hypothetical protein